MFKIVEICTYIYWRIFHSRIRAFFERRRSSSVSDEAYLNINAWNLQGDEYEFYMSSRPTSLKDIDSEIQDFLLYLEESFWFDDHTPDNPFSAYLENCNFIQIVKFREYLRNVDDPNRNQQRMIMCCENTIFDYLRSCKWSLKRKVLAVMGDEYFGSLTMKSLFRTYDSCIRDMMYCRGLI